MNGDSPQSGEFRRALNESARLLRENRPEEAIVILRDLARQAPDDADIAINLGGAYILQRQWSRAVRVLRKALERNPQTAMLWANLGAAELGQMELSGPRQQKNSIAAYERALQVDPSAPNVHYHLGLIYKHRGEFNRASAFFQRALEVRPGDRDAAYWLERMHELAEEQRKRATSSQADVSPPSGTGLPVARYNQSSNGEANGHHKGPLPPTGSDDERAEG